MYKCDKCNELKWAMALSSDGTQECLDCMILEVDSIADETAKVDVPKPPMPPPLGWLGRYDESEIMYQYGLIGTRKFKGKPN